MLFILRNIRRKLMMEKKVITYILYALGEITLVVIGILIAVQIDNWNEAYKNQKKEIAFLVNLKEDLRTDSVRLQAIKEKVEQADLYKKVFERKLEGKMIDEDSIVESFAKQYQMLVEFIPTKTTINELTNSVGFSIISNPTLRRQIVSLYYNYEDLVLKIKLGQTKGQSINNYVSEKVKNINQLTPSEINELMNDPYYVNQTKMNYLSTQAYAITSVNQQCIETLNLIRKELNQ